MRLNLRTVAFWVTVGLSFLYAAEVIHGYDLQRRLDRCEGKLYAN